MLTPKENRDSLTYITKSLSMIWTHYDLELTWTNLEGIDTIYKYMYTQNWLTEKETKKNLLLIEIWLDNFALFTIRKSKVTFDKDVVRILEKKNIF